MEFWVLEEDNWEIWHLRSQYHEPVASSLNWPVFAESASIFSEHSDDLSGEGIYEFSCNVEIVFELFFVIKM
jgi:hypothetical protein